MSALLELLGGLTGSALGLALSAYVLRRSLHTRAGREAAEDLAYLSDRLSWFGAGLLRRPNPATSRPRSISACLVGLAVGRLAAAMSDAEKERWAEEMAADLTAVPGRLRRLLFAWRLWRKGAPAIPVRAADAPRSADS